ncbi:DUF2505 domain-containing protein [Sinimarinibacterium thermocellulolyticum]|uniref:DUF2505 domain-containing protein n=1 Tax=Sinimarinibacterium thermocellulolyticum TaxID=3170016 RepID=A0ABV2ACF5_9GAMM
MKFDDKHSFNKPAATVIKMFSDRAYFERKYQMLGFTGIEVLEHEKSDKHFRIKVRYIAKNDVQVPDMLKKFMPGQITVVQQDAWDLTRMTGRLDVEIKGTPVKVSADMTLKDEGKGSANHLKWTVSCSVPLVGGKLEKLTADDIQAKAGRDVATTQKILNDY